MEKKIWLSSPDMGGQEMNYIKSAFDDNWIAPLGPNVNGFEKDLSDYLGSDNHVAVLSSGTAALHLALILLGIEKGDDVLCQSLTFSASANVIKYIGGNPIFIDSELQTWNLCPQVLEDAIKARISLGKKPKALIAVSLYGMPYRMDEVLNICHHYGISVIEDSAESLGSMYKGQKLGTFGDISVISFNGNKIITTSGGGALISKNPDHKRKAIYLATQAKEDAPHYEHVTLGYNYRMSNIAAGIGRGQMEVLSNHISRRRANHFFYKSILDPVEGVSILHEPDENFYSNHWLNAILIDEKKINKSREDLRLAFLEHNIESRPLWKPMHLQPFFKDELYFGGQNAENLFEMGLCLPSGSNLTESDKIRIKEVLENFFF